MNPLLRATAARRPATTPTPPFTLPSSGMVSSNRNEAASAAAPTTVSAQNDARHPSVLMMAAPRSGATTGPMTNSTCMMPSTEPRCSASNASFTTAMLTDDAPPAPSPCSTRANTKISIMGASAHTRLPTAYSM